MGARLVPGVTEEFGSRWTGKLVNKQRSQAEEHGAGSGFSPGAGDVPEKESAVLSNNIARLPQ